MGNEIRYLFPNYVMSAVLRAQILSIDFLTACTNMSLVGMTRSGPERQGAMSLVRKWEGD
jgi:hypothetical protein